MLQMKQQVKVYHIECNTGKGDCRAGSLHSRESVTHSHGKVSLEILEPICIVSVDCSAIVVVVYAILFLTIDLGLRQCFFQRNQKILKLFF